MINYSLVVLITKANWNFRLLIHVHVAASIYFCHHYARLQAYYCSLLRPENFSLYIWKSALMVCLSPQLPRSSSILPFRVSCKTPTTSGCSILGSCQCKQDWKDLYILRGDILVPLVKAS